MKLADALVATLRDWGVRYVFGVSGANIEHFHDAIHRLGGNRLESVLAKSEVGAAFMADARARVHKTLGVCCSTSGGGMMNLAVGVAESYAESVPVLAIVGQVSTALEGRGGFQDSSGIGRTVDALGMWRAISKSAVRLEGGEGFWPALEHAVRTALGGRPGPSVLLVPRDAYEREVPERPAWFPMDLAALARPAPPSRSAVTALFDALRSARRPALLLGPGATQSRDADASAIVRFAIEAGAPVATTMANPGAFPNDHPLYLGTVGTAGHPSAHAYLAEKADLIVAVGTDLGAMIRQPFARAFERARLAVVNVDPAEIARAIRPALVVEADCGAVFRELRRMRDAAPFAYAPIDYELTRYLPEVVEQGDGGGGLLQSQAVDLLEEHLPANGHVLFDAGNCAAAAIHGMFVPRGATATIALGMGGMGYAIAGAVGAQLASAPGTRSMVLCGDGAFLMLGLEVHTAVEHRLPILFVVFNNAKHGMCATRQNVYFGGRVTASEYARVDVAAVARGLGDEAELWVGRASTADELRRALAAYRADTDRPGVLELVLTREEIPPFAPFLAHDHPTYTASRTRHAEWIQPAA